jgi:cell division protein FtsL
VKPLQLILGAAVLASMFSIVTSSHASRKLFIAIERADTQAKRLDTEFRQLQVEQTALAKPGLIDSSARRDLQMERVTPAHTLYLNAQDARAPAAKPAATPAATPTAPAGAAQ